MGHGEIDHEKNLYFTCIDGKSGSANTIFNNHIFKRHNIPRVFIANTCRDVGDNIETFEVSFFEP